jgi:hypothetical protein
MKGRLPPDVPLAIVIFATVAAVALRAVARRPEPLCVVATEPAPVTATAADDGPQSG